MKDKIKDFTCPVCGSSNFEVIEENEIVAAPFGEEKTVPLLKIKCNICESLTDYSKIYEAEYSNALEESKKQSIEYILNNLNNKGYNLASIERALDLPQRTISRWKSTGELSSTGLALLRIINTYPWILHVAQNKFETACARNIFIQNAMTDLLSIYSSYNHSYFSEVGVIAHPKNFYIIAKYDLNETKEEEEVIHKTLQIGSSSPTTFSNTAQGATR